MEEEDKQEKEETLEEVKARKAKERQEQKERREQRRAELGGRMRRLGDFDLDTLRLRFVKDGSKFVRARPWLLRVPYDILEVAIRDLQAARASAISNLRQKGKFFHWKRVNFRKWEERRSTIAISHTVWGRRRGFFAGFFGPDSVASKDWRKQEHKLETPKLEIKHDVRLRIDRLGKWYLHVPAEIQQGERAARGISPPPSSEAPIEAKH